MTKANLIRKVKGIINGCGQTEEVWIIRNRLTYGLDKMVDHKEIKSYGFAICGVRSSVLIHNNDDTYSEVKCKFPAR